MKKTISFYDFRNEFDSIRPDNFTYEGLSILFDYLEQLELDCDITLELDVIGLCCDYNEAHFSDIAKDYDIDLSECNDEFSQREAVKSYLEDNGFGYCGICEDNCTFVYQTF